MTTGSSDRPSPDWAAATTRTLTGLRATQLNRLRSEVADAASTWNACSIQMQDALAGLSIEDAIYYEPSEVDLRTRCATQMIVRNRDLVETLHTENALGSSELTKLTTHSARILHTELPHIPADDLLGWVDLQDAHPLAVACLAALWQLMSQNSPGDNVKVFPVTRSVPLAALPARGTANAKGSAVGGYTSSVEEVQQAKVFMRDGHIGPIEIALRNLTRLGRDPLYVLHILDYALAHGIEFATLDVRVTRHHVYWNTPEQTRATASKLANGHKRAGMNIPADVLVAASGVPRR